MKHIFLNLKRFDISPEKGGVNRLAPMKDWGRTIVSGTQDALTAYDPAEVEFVMYMPEAHLLGAAAAKTENSPVQLGCQGVYRADTAVGGNFGAFTAQLTANSAAGLGCEWALIGHCEERAAKAGILAAGGGDALLDGGGDGAQVHMPRDNLAFRADNADKRLFYFLVGPAQTLHKRAVSSLIQSFFNVIASQFYSVMPVFRPLFYVGAEAL